MEAGDTIMLAYRMVTTTHYISVFPKDPDIVKSDGFMGWDWKGSERTAKLCPVAGDDLWDEDKALVFTVRKSRRNKISLEAVVDGEIRPLSDVGNMVAFKKVENPYYSSLGFRPSVAGYQLRFKSRDETHQSVGPGPRNFLVSNKPINKKVLGMDVDNKHVSLDFVPVVYVEPPAKFAWDARPTAEDGGQINDREQFTMRLCKAGNDDRSWDIIQDWWATGYHMKADFNRTTPGAVFTMHKNTDSRGYTISWTPSNKNSRLYGKTLTLSAATDPKAGNKVIALENPTPQDASIACELVAKGHRIYFKSHMRTPVEGQENLVVTPSQYPMTFTSHRKVKEVKVPDEIKDAQPGPTRESEGGDGARLEDKLETGVDAENDE